MCVQFLGIEETNRAIAQVQERELRYKASIVLKIPRHELPTDSAVLERMIWEKEESMKAKPKYTWTTIADCIEKRRTLGNVFA